MSTRTILQVRQYHGHGGPHRPLNTVTTPVDVLGMLGYHSLDNPGAPLGTEVDVVIQTADEARRAKLRLCRNNSGSTIALGAMVATDESATVVDPCQVKVAPANSALAACQGVTAVAVLTLEYFWAVCQGTFEALSNGSTTAGVQQKVSATAGQMADGVLGTNEHPAWALEANASAGTRSLMSIDC